LQASFRHHAGLRTQHREVHLRRARQRAVAPPELDDVLHRKARGDEPRALGRDVGGRERDQVQPGIARDLPPELVRERRIVGRGEYLQEAEFELGEPVRRAGRLQHPLGVEVGLHIDERHAKTEPLERAARSLEVGDEIADMVDEDLALLRQLPPGPARVHSTVGQSISSSATIHGSASAPSRHSANAGNAIIASM
jgi:hypothetical protein